MKLRCNPQIGISVSSAARAEKYRRFLIFLSIIAF
jgi:hypothetical protein